MTMYCVCDLYMNLGLRKESFAIRLLGKVKERNLGCKKCIII